LGGGGGFEPPELPPLGMPLLHCFLLLYGM